MGQRDALDGVGAMRELGGFRFEEFPPRRRVVVEVAHLDDGAGAERGRFRGAPGSALRRQAWLRPAAGWSASGARPRRPRPAPRRESRAWRRVRGRRAWRSSTWHGGSAPARVRPGDAAAVVADADQLDAAFFELDLDRLAAGVERVFEQFLEHRAGRSTTSPAAIWLIREVGRRWMCGGGGLHGHRRIIPARLIARPVAQIRGTPASSTIALSLHPDRHGTHRLLHRHRAASRQASGRDGPAVRRRIYAILFAIIFSETGFVVTPFLPGDSLLFVAGALAALGGWTS